MACPVDQIKYRVHTTQEFHRRRQGLDRIERARQKRQGRHNKVGDRRHLIELVGIDPGNDPQSPHKCRPNWRRTKTSAHSGWARPIPKASIAIAPTAIATINPRSTPPVTYPSTNSPADNGGINVSTIFPCTFAITIEDDVLANAFCSTVIIRMPGNKNSTNGTPITSALCRPMANVNMVRKSPAVISGASKVCVQTAANR